MNIEMVSELWSSDFWQRTPALKDTMIPVAVERYEPIWSTRRPSSFEYSRQSLYQFTHDDKTSQNVTYLLWRLGVS